MGRVRLRLSRPRTMRDQRWTGEGKNGAYHVVQRFLLFVGLHLALVPGLVRVGGHGIVLLAVGHDGVMYWRGIGRV